MPGIVGIVTRMPREWAEPRLMKMVEALRHEPFYQTGVLVDESLGVYVGEIAARDASASGMPTWSRHESVAIVFSGEEYSEPADTHRGNGRSHAAKDPSWMVRLYEDDPHFPATLNGLFHGIVVDRGRRIARLFNDRYGMHRICYHFSSDAFYFAAEAKGILAVCPELRRPNHRSLAEFVACSCVLENRTIFQDVQVMPGGSVWTFHEGNVEKKAYFIPREWEEQDGLEPEEYHRELRNVLTRSLPRYFNSGERVGMTLTGGLDTRVIMALHKSPAGALPCYTFGGMFRDSEDVRIARRVASVCKQSHHVITVGEEFLKAFPRYAERSVYLTEGSVDVNRSPDLYVSEKARAIAPVKVVGTYGSEIIRQAVMFKPVTPVAGLFQPEMLSGVSEAHTTYADLRRSHPVTFAAFRQSPWYHHGVLAIEGSQLFVRSPFLDNDFVQAVYRAPKQSSTADVRWQLVRDGNPALAAIPTDRGFGGDTNSIAASLSRFWLDFTVKAEYAFDYGMPQWVARVDHTFSALHAERLFLGRHKSAHFRVWYRDALSGYVREVLLDPAALARPYLNRKEVESVVEGHLKGNQNYTSEIHKLLTLELLHRRFFDAQ